MKIIKNKSPDFKNNAKNMSGLRTKSAFTLVELIVVITILAILGTIAFISLQGYSRDARDSTRMADINSINTQLELFVIKAGTLPIPENNIELISSGVTIGYQGYADINTLNILKVFNGGLDPVNQSPYIYRISGNKKSYQIMGFLENGNVVAGLFSQANAATDLTNRFPFSKGKVLGILLEPITNTPLQELLGTGQVDIRNYTGSVDMYLSNIVKQTGKVNELYGTMENLSRSQKFNKPQKDCPKGYIPVPGNIDFGQPAFCVAKYEMSYNGLIQTDNSGDWNIYSYIDNAGTRPGLGFIISEQGNSPIAEISQLQAIVECKAIGLGYHLITNNEWMALGRNIEQQGINWNTGIVGSGYLYNGISNSSMGCDINHTGGNPLSGRWATITGNTNCSNKNRLTLSNGEQIWDLVGNIWEHVNKANTLDGTKSALGTTSIAGTLGTPTDYDGIYLKDDMNKYGSILGYGLSKGMGSIFISNGVLDNIFTRGGNASIGNNGIFQLGLGWAGGTIYKTIGFRCAK